METITQAATKVVTLSFTVSGGELAITYRPTGAHSYWWNTHPVSAREFRRIWLNKRPI